MQWDRSLVLMQFLRKERETARGVALYACVLFKKNSSAVPRICGKVFLHGTCCACQRGDCSICCENTVIWLRCEHLSAPQCGHDMSPCKTLKLVLSISPKTLMYPFLLEAAHFIQCLSPTSKGIVRHGQHMEHRHAMSNSSRGTLTAAKRQPSCT